MWSVFVFRNLTSPFLTAFLSLLNYLFISIALVNILTGFRSNLDLIIKQSGSCFYLRTQRLQRGQYQRNKINLQHANQVEKSQHFPKKLLSSPIFIFFPKITISYKDHTNSNEAEKLCMLRN